MGVIQKQGIQNTIITYAGIVIGFISLIFVQPNLLSATELGLLRILISFSGFIATILPLGVGNVNVRYFPFFKDSEKKHHGYFGLMLLFPLAGCLLGGILLYLSRDLIIAQYVKESKLFTDYFAYVFPIAAFIAFLNAFNAYATALYRTVFPSLNSDVINRLLIIAAIVLYFFQLVDLDQFVFLIALVYALQMVLAVVYIYAIDTPGLVIDLSFLKTVDLKGMIRYGMLLMLTSISSISLKFLDSMFIAKFMPLAFVGIYSIAAFMATVIETPLAAMERIATAKIASAWAHQNMKELKEIYYRSARYMSLLGGILLLGILTNVKDVLRLLPPEYHGGATVTVLISCAAFINMATGVNYSIIYNSSKYVYGMSFIVILLLLTIAGNMVLIPRYGIEGAAVSTAFASIVYNLLKYVFIWKKFGMQPFDASTLKILLVIAISGGANYLLPEIHNPILSIAFRSSVITIVYCITTYLLSIVPEFHKYIPFLKRNA